MPIIFGKDATDNILPLLLDASGNIIVSASQLTTTGGKIKVDASGRLIVDGETPSLFRPTPKTTLFSNTALPAGTSVQTLATVPSGEIWRFTMISMQYVGTVAGVTLRARLNNTVTTSAFLLASTV